MRAKAAWLLGAVLAISGAAVAVPGAPAPEADGACIGTNALRCLAMVYYCTYVVATDPVNSLGCLTVIEPSPDQTCSAGVDPGQITNCSLRIATCFVAGLFGGACVA